MSSDDIQNSQGSSKGKVIKLVVFALIVVLILVEARAKLGYSSAISGLDALLEKSAEESTLEAAEAAMPYFPSKALTSEGKMSNLYLYSWPSLLNYGGYKISLYVSKTDPPLMLKFKMGEAKLEVVKPMSQDDAKPMPAGGISFGGDQ